MYYLVHNYFGWQHLAFDYPSGEVLALRTQDNAMLQRNRIYWHIWSLQTTLIIYNYCIFFYLKTWFLLLCNIIREFLKIATSVEGNILKQHRKRDWQLPIRQMQISMKRHMPWQIMTAKSLWAGPDPVKENPKPPKIRKYRQGILLPPFEIYLIFYISIFCPINIR